DVSNRQGHRDSSRAVDGVRTLGPSQRPRGWFGMSVHGSADTFHKNLGKNSVSWAGHEYRICDGAAMRTSRCPLHTLCGSAIHGMLVSRTCHCMATLPMSLRPLS